MRRAVAIMLAAGLSISLAACATTSQADTCGRLLSIRAAAIGVRDASLSLLQNPDVSPMTKAKAEQALASAIATIAGIDGACPLPPVS